MSGAASSRIDDLLRAVGGDEEAFNRSVEARRLGVYLHRGHLYPLAVGQTHTARLMTEIRLVGARYRCRSARQWK